MILILQNRFFSVKCVDELSSGHTSTTLSSWHTLSPWRTVRHLALPPGLPQYQAAASWWAQKQQSSGPLTLRPVKLVKVIDLGLVSRAQLAWCTTPPVWSRITAEPQSSLIQSALHIVSPSLCLSASTFEDGAYHRTPTHTRNNAHTFFFFFYLDVISVPEVSHHRAAHLLPIPPSEILFTSDTLQSSHTYMDKHTQWSLNPIYLWCGIIHCCRCVTGQRTHQTWCQGECGAEGEEQMEAGLVLEENGWVVWCGSKFEIGLNSLSGWWGGMMSCVTQ